MWLLPVALALVYCWFKREDIYFAFPSRTRFLTSYLSRLIAEVCNLPDMADMIWPPAAATDLSIPARSPWDHQQANTTQPSISPNCPVCGRAASKKCTRCRRVKYCSAGCQRDHWNQGHRHECQPASSLPLSEVSPSRPPTDFGNAAVAGEQSPHPVSQAPAQPPIEVGQPQLVQLPHAEPVAQELAPLASHVIFPYDGYLQLAASSNNRLPLGMINCGNSCYAASVLQCLLQTPGITEYLARSSHSRHCTVPEAKWCLLCELQRLLNSPDVHSYRPPSFLRLNRSVGPSRACSVKPFIDHVEEIGPDFSVGQQEDAHEFFVQLLDRIESIMLAEAGGRKLFNHRSQETTMVNHAFLGYICNQTLCQVCGHASKVFESCMSLPLELPEGIHSLEDALAAYMRQEKLEGENQYRCDLCNKNVDAVRSCRFEVLPNTLQICLKRFQVGFFGKIGRHISFPGKLNLTPFRAACSIDCNPAEYTLHSVIVHIGGASSYSYGHYICFIRTADNIWHKCDDDEVQSVHETEVTNSAAYMLFYQRTVPKPSPQELAHAASLQPSAAPVAVRRGVQASNDHEVKLQARGDFPSGKENVSAAANAASQDTQHLKPDVLRGRQDMAGSLGPGSSGWAVPALSPSSRESLDGTATLQSVSNSLPQPAASPSPMQVPRFRIKPVLVESRSQVCPGLEVQVELPGISSCAAVHAYLIRDCFTLTAGTFHLQLHLDAPDICLRDLKYQPRRSRLMALLEIPARSQPQFPQNSWGSHTADQQSAAEASDSLRQPSSNIPPSSESLASQELPGALPQLPHSFNPTFPSDSSPLPADMLQGGFAPLLAVGSSSEGSNPETCSASATVPARNTNLAVLSSAADINDCNYPQPEQHSHHFRPASDDFIQPHTLSQSVVTRLVADSPAQLVSSPASDQAASSNQTIGLEDDKPADCEAETAIERGGPAAQLAVCSTLPEHCCEAGPEGSIHTQPLRKEQNLHCLNVNAHPHENQNITQESPGIVRAAA